MVSEPLIPFAKLALLIAIDVLVPEISTVVACVAIFDKESQYIVPPEKITLLACKAKEPPFVLLIEPPETVNVPFVFFQKIAPEFVILVLSPEISIVVAPSPKTVSV